MAFQKRSFVGKGKLYLGRYGQNNLQRIGNTSKLSLSIDEETKELADYENPGGGVADALSRIAKQVRDIPDFPKPGILFKDITPILSDADAFQAAYEKEIKPIVSANKGIVAFETIFGYGGTGHVDLHDGEALSDAPNWYPCKRLHLWNIVVP